MPDIPEEDQHIPADSQAESFPVDQITGESDANIESPEPVIMEVHKHPHHVTHKKKWGEYLLEFIMLFLAVFLGFIAENVRENLVEQHREKEYIHSITEDIKSDTLLSGRVLGSLGKTLAGLDSLIETLASPDAAANSNDAYRLWNKYLGFADFVSNDGTIQQLKNSGGLRLIRNKAVADTIMKYDRIVRAFYLQAELMNKALTDQVIFQQLFDFISLKKNKELPVPLTEQGKKLLNQAYANRKIWRFGIGVLRSQLQDLHDIGKRLLPFLQEQYGDD